jgi:ferredoxin-like protein FixX
VAVVANSNCAHMLAKQRTGSRDQYQRNTEFRCVLSLLHDVQSIRRHIVRGIEDKKVACRVLALCTCTCTHALYVRRGRKVIARQIHACVDCGGIPILGLGSKIQTSCFVPKPWNGMTCLLHVVSRNISIYT